MFQLGTAVVEADGRTGGGDGRPRLRWRLLQRNRALMRLLQRGARIALGREGREGRSTPGKGLTRHRPARPASHGRHLSLRDRLCKRMHPQPAEHSSTEPG